jgi:hypothetical protein
MLKRIVVNSSDLSKITGHNKFDPLQIYTDKLLNKHNIVCKHIPKSNIEKKLLGLNKEALQKIKKELNLKNGATLQDVEQKLNIITSNSKTNSTEQGSKDDLKKSLKEKPNVNDLLKDSIEKDIRMVRGNIKENTALNKSQKSLKTNIVKRNNEFYTKSLFKTDKCDVYLCGKVDGITEDNRLVETKSRRNKLFNKIPIYEKVQMECYMYLTDIPTCVHVENFNETQNISEYNHTEKFWNECLDKTKLYIMENVDTHL